MAGFEVTPPPGSGFPRGQRPPDPAPVHPPSHGHPPAPLAPAPVDPGQPPPVQPAQPQRKGIMGFIGLGLVALAKYKFLIFGSLKTAVTMLISIWFWAQLYGWPFAAGFVILIFVHEMGHVFAAKLLGMPVTAPLFIPFVGAAIYLKENPRDAWSEALMAYGGPLAGTIGGFICFAIAWQTSTPWLMAVAASTFFINLFNLIPVPPLDGGRICAAVSTWFWILGLILLGVAVFYFQAGLQNLWHFSPMFALLWVFVIGSIFASAIARISQTFRQRGTPQMQAYFAISLAGRFTMAVLYLGIIVVALYGYFEAKIFLQSAS